MTIWQHIICIHTDKISSNNIKIGRTSHRSVNYEPRNLKLLTSSSYGHRQKMEWQWLWQRKEPSLWMLLSPCPLVQQRSAHPLLAVDAPSADRCEPHSSPLLVGRSDRSWSGSQVGLHCPYVGSRCAQTVCKHFVTEKICPSYNRIK